MSREHAGRGLAIVGGALVAAACALLFWGWSMNRAATAPQAAPAGSESAAAADDGFAVDWAYWQGINPDVVGWVRVEGTNVSLPIVQAHADDPERYLTHDVYGDWNIYGAAYLDAECEGDGLLGSANAVISGHHLDDGSMFSELTSYQDADWAAEHPTVDLYAPGPGGATLHESRSVAGAETVAGWEPAKRTDFSNADELPHWIDERTEGGVSLQSAQGAEKCATLVTCSTFDWSRNARCLCYAIRK